MNNTIKEGFYVTKGENVDDVFRFYWTLYPNPFEQAKKRLFYDVKGKSLEYLRPEIDVRNPVCPNVDWHVDIDGNELVVSGRNPGVGRYTVEYYGPPELFSPYYKLKNCQDEVILGYKNELEAAYSNGDGRVRKSNSSGEIVFNVDFPRYRKDGTWWSGENACLSTDRELAREQIEFAFSQRI